jgi:WhiB family transcriptional regulator, redox-sensing transcriptional regulator
VSSVRVATEWQSKAACRGPFQSVFFPPSMGEGRLDKVRRESRAKSICAQCSVRTPCLDYAISIREPHGVWGGLNEIERRDLLP